MTKWGLSSLLLVIISSLVLTDPLIAHSKEDTAYISFQRIGVSKDQSDAYVVKKNEWLFDIIERRYKVSKKEAARILELVKSFNPQLKDLNVIYPGQTLLLPRKRSSETAGTPDVSNQASGILSDEKRGDIILKYVIQRGDHVSGIIHKKYGGSRGKIYKILERVKLLNPMIRNLDRIYPGQTLLLPRTAEEAKPSPLVLSDVQTEAVTIPEYSVLPVISHIINRMYGTIITDGNFCIPIPPSGEVKIDCARVPVIEIPDGNTILLDLSSRIPEELKRVIESTWENYRVISVKEHEKISSLLERVLHDSGIYIMKTVNQYKQIGTAPETRIFVEWLVSRKSQSEGTGGYAFNFVSEPSQLIPLPVKAYADEGGLEIIEIMDGVGISEDEEKYQPCTMKVLDYQNGVSLADSLLTMLGYSPIRDSEISILNEDGLDLSITVDLLLTAGERRIIVTSNGISEQVRHILEKRGDTVVVVSNGENRRVIIENVMRAMNISCLYDDFMFLLSGHTGKERGNISLPALWLGDDEPFYLVDYDIDNGMCGLLEKEWKVKLVRY
ncbi:MAG TPA: LysM peptidoglycan-binding domain-containing protein [Syntrophales bacterium]|nr:LysM peptidoglycan-binding domain-containing protein [Syntrophales bacterium]HPQ44180.1 LysM peptidoglycan-binding domain-containing protein [Syntrophales bacterium]